ncbi:MAG: 50S ribosomal protein L9 [bacterium]|nr:50S ribosomal protein L9 [bacterium]
MKVIMLRDVKGVGRAHESVDASDGYALNFLIPRKYAVAATPSALKTAEERKKKVVVEKEIQVKLVAQNLATLAEARIVIKAKVNEKGHLYDAVGEPEIILAAKREAGVDLPEGVVKLEKPIKEVGIYDIPIASGEIFGKFSITVEGE